MNWGLWVLLTGQKTDQEMVMNRLSLLFAALLLAAAFAFSSCGGGGGGTTFAPPGDINQIETYAFMSNGKVVRFPRGGSISMFVESGEGVTGYIPAFGSAARTYMLKWNDIGAPYGLFNISETSNSQTSSIYVKWVQSLGGNNAGRTSYRTQGTTLLLPVLIELPTHINGRQNNSGTVGLAAIHEMGHALGLWEHSTSQSDVMFPVASRASFSQRDINTIYKLYHTPTFITSYGRGVSSLKDEVEVVTVYSTDNCRHCGMQFD